MIDHVLGRPSSKFRKLQVFAVVSFWSFYLSQGDPHGPPILRRISQRLGRRLTAWQTVVLTMLWLYFCRNFAKIMGLTSPEPLANLYTKSYFRATWITTALDAGFWTAMPIKRKWMRDAASMVFSVFYLFAAEAADDKVRKVRATLTVEHMRVSWNKATTPYLKFLNNLARPKLMRYPPRKIRIARPPESAYQEPVVAWLYFDGPLVALEQHEKVLLDVPGGGFVAMDPRTNDDKLMAWAGKLRIPVVSLDYRKAPEYPYPYALNEVFDVYSTIMQSKGRVLGLSGQIEPRIVITGDSAGGNLVTSSVLMIIQSGMSNMRRSPREGSRTLTPPEGVILVYPGLDMNIGNWMTDEQMSLIQDRRTRSTNATILRRKSEDYSKLTPFTPYHSDDEASSSFMRRTATTIKLTDLPDSAVLDEPLDTAVEPGMTHETRRSSVASRAESGDESTRARRSSSVSQYQADITAGKPQVLRTRLAMSSMISYFNDRILTPEMMRSMIILYIGPHNRPDFSTDYLLSPLLAPDSLLARFPKTYIMTGERDPLVDDTVIFAGRLRQAKYAAWVQRREMGMTSGAEREFDERDHVVVRLIPGVSHGFLQFAGVFPEGWRHIHKCAEWATEIFSQREEREEEVGRHSSAEGEAGRRGNARHHVRRPTESSGDDEPLEMSMMMTKSGGSGSARRKTAGPEMERDLEKGRGRGRGGRGREERPRVEQRTKSSVSLASAEGLLGRRMEGMTNELMGLNEDN